jgi:hypothetical protein
MNRFFLKHVSSILAGLALLMLSVGLVMAGCAPGLPEPASEDAKLYVQFCSGEGCHGPIPPQASGRGYWRNQYSRMIDLMETRGWPLPNAEQDRKIRDYLQRNAG